MKNVLVVGAGPTGLTVALELARQGWMPHVIEKSAAGSTLSRAVGLLPSSMEVFEPSGVADAIRKEAVVYEQAAFYLGSSMTSRIPLLSEDGQEAMLLGLAQDRTEVLLKAALEQAGGTVHHEVALVSLEIESSHAVATLCSGENGREVRDFDLVVGADGVHSVVRRSLGIAFEGYDLPELWSIADVEVEGWDTSVFSVFRLTRGRMVVVAPLGTNRVRIISNTDDALKALPVPIEVTRTQRAVTFNISVRQVKQYNYGPVYLAGDAAHCHSPAGGRGMNLGIADAADLSRRILEDDLEDYGLKRHAAARNAIAYSERGRRAMTSRSPAVRLGVSMTLKMLERNSSVRQGVMAKLLELN